MKNLLLLIFYIGFVHILNAQSIRITGTWNYTIPSSDITEAGKDFTGTYESNVNQVYLDITYNRNWTVSVQKNNIDWDNKIRIFMHRTGNGFGRGRIQGGKNYKRIRNKDAKFISGRGARYSIPLQYQIRNISATIPAHNYIVEIMYTLTGDSIIITPIDPTPF